MPGSAAVVLSMIAVLIQLAPIHLAPMGTLARESFVVDGAAAPVADTAAHAAETDPAGSSPGLLDADTATVRAAGAARDGEGRRPAHPTVATDVAVIGGLTAAVTLLNPDVRRGVFTEGSLTHVLANFRHPIRRALEGGRDDDDAFIHNGVAHPLSWGGMGYYLRRRGYSRRDALLFTQAHSIVWEYVIEGSFQKPSGKDLVTNFVSSGVAVLLSPGRLAPSSDPPGLSYRASF